MRGIDLKKIAEKMPGASGAELKVMSCPLQLTLNCVWPLLSMCQHGIDFSWET